MPVIVRHARLKILAHLLHIVVLVIVNHTWVNGVNCTGYYVDLILNVARK